MGCFNKCMTMLLLFIQFIAVATIFGISAYLQSQTRDNENLLSMIPLCFTAFAILTTLIGFVSISKRSYCGFVTYSVFSCICIVGFMAAVVATGLWLTEKPVLPDTLVEWIENHGDANVTTGELSDLCKDFEEAEVEFSEIDLDEIENDVDNANGLKEKVDAALGKFNVTKLELKELLGYCRAEQLMFDLLAGRSEDTHPQTISIILGVCIGSAALILDYLLTMTFGCCFVRAEDKFA